MSGSLARSAVVLGLMAAVGPLAIDMYLPALPGIERDLQSGIAATQMTLSAFFLAFGVFQMIYGPLSDQLGRKVPLYIGLSIFLIGSLACALAPSIELLIAARFVQGIGAASVMVMPRAIVRDMFTGYEATRLMALIMLVISVSPMLAPLIGTVFMGLGDWHAIFLFLAAIAVLSLLMTRFMLPETLPPEQRVAIRPATLLRGLKMLSSDPMFMGLSLIGGCGMASFFVFIASASFVYTDYYGLSEVQFSLAFAANAIGFFASSQFAAGLGQRLGVNRLIAYAISGFLAVETVLLMLVLNGFDQLPVVMACLFLGNACLGLVIPTCMVLALERHGKIAGLASSLGGTLQMVTGGLMIVAVSPFFDGSVTPMVAAIFTCSLAAFILLHALKVGRAAVDPTPGF
ncbi:multidrug effflux MFS transporter [Roseibium limicola]|uniref:Bcr/CflA family efflux transporter n=1 Tax=Roseibium limicola TaxID=2816037 RepID=A0A939J6U8_9HYPH|nr:multidrug effflux MFS transporter [Roseibium limicola]MBO0345487.1 multidrug effflux MFS transporter [Roseibium limicola]